MSQFMPIRPWPSSPPNRSGLPACAILSAPGKRTMTSAGVRPQVFITTPNPPMFVPEPGIVSRVVIPPATAVFIDAVRNWMLSTTRSSGLTWNTMSCRSEAPVWLCISMMPGMTQSPVASMICAPAGISTDPNLPTASIFLPLVTHDAVVDRRAP